ncbi:MAG: HlyD family efflux transporter periplasmic adaptor subunit [Ferruginibacter sp.]
MEKYFLNIIFLVSLLFTSCQSKNEAAEEDISGSVTPVTVVTISNGPLEDCLELNATSVFRQKWMIKSNLNGYLQNSTVQLNKMVRVGQALFSVKTKEAVSIGNTINILDSTFNFSGVNTIRSNGTGFISELNHQPGDYVQDGEQLAVVTDTKSFVFLLNMPYSMRPYLNGKSSFPLTLPDGEVLTASIAGTLPLMDSVSQTQQVILKVNTSHLVPENLIAKVKLVKNSKPNAMFLPKATILADETQSDFWVMKLINDSTAVKTIIKKGIETGNQVEILSPLFSPQDKILATGNYALPDTAKVKVITPSSTKD